MIERLYAIYFLILFGLFVDGLSVIDPTNSEVICPNNGECTISCNNCTELRYIECNSNVFKCSITCLGINSCNGITIYGNNIYYININCISRYSCSDMNINILLYNNESKSIIKCHSTYACYNTRIIIDSILYNYDINNNVYISDNAFNDFRSIDLSCYGDYSCSNVFYMLSSINNVSLDCNGLYSCNNMIFNYNVKNISGYNDININCNGNNNNACNDMIINGLSSRYININCDDNNCNNMDIYCPINNQIQSCQINGNSNELNMYAIYGDTQVKYTGISINNQIYCEYTLNSNNCENSGITENTDINAILRTANDTDIICKDNKDCLVYAFKEYNEIKSVTCPMNAFCYIKCINVDGCANIIINAESSTLLTIDVTKNSDNGLQNATINAPINGDLTILTNYGSNIFKNAIINAHLSDNINITQLNGNNIFNGAIFNIENIDSINMDCNTGTNVCQSMFSYLSFQIQIINPYYYTIYSTDMNLFINSTNFNPTNPIIPSEININCENTTNCLYSHVYITYNNGNSNDVYICPLINCSLGYIISSNPTLQPVIQTPIITPTTLSTKSSPVITLRITRKNLPWIVASILAFIFGCICCGAIFYLINERSHKKRMKLQQKLRQSSDYHANIQVNHSPNSTSAKINNNPSNNPNPFPDSNRNNNINSNINNIDINGINDDDIIVPRQQTPFDNDDISDRLSNHVSVVSEQKFIELIAKNSNNNKPNNNNNINPNNNQPKINRKNRPPPPKKPMKPMRVVSNSDYSNNIIDDNKAPPGPPGPPGPPVPPKVRKPKASKVNNRNKPKPKNINNNNGLQLNIQNVRANLKSHKNRSKSQPKHLNKNNVNNRNTSKSKVDALAQKFNNNNNNNIKVKNKKFRKKSAPVPGEQEYGEQDMVFDNGYLVTNGNQKKFDDLYDDNNSDDMKDDIKYNESIVPPVPPVPQGGSNIKIPALPPKITLNKVDSIYNSVADDDGNDDMNDDINDDIYGYNRNNNEYW